MSQFAKKWKAKIEDLKKRIDCEYDWGAKFALTEKTAIMLKKF